MVYILLTTADQFPERNYKVKGYYINQCMEHIQEYFVLATILILIRLNKRENRAVHCTLKNRYFFSINIGGTLYLLICLKMELCINGVSNH